jgi:hypothetical protein
MIGVPSAPKATGAVLAISERPDEDRGSDRNRRSEPGRSLEEGAEAKGDEQELEPAVAGDPGEAFLEHLEMAFLLGQVVEKNDVEDDPANREKAVGGAEECDCAGLVGRHSEDGDGDDDGRGQAEDRGPVGLEPEEREGPEKDDDRDGGNERREKRVSERIINLLPGHFLRLYHRISEFDILFCYDLLSRAMGRGKRYSRIWRLAAPLEKSPSILETKMERRA